MRESSRYPVRFVFTTIVGGLIMVAVWLTAGCGGGSAPAPPTPAFAMNGNFSITATSAVTPQENTFGGAVDTDSAGKVSGIVHVQGPFFLCLGAQFDLPLAGTIDSTGRLNANITSLNNQTITLNASVSSDGARLSNGSYSGSGTGCAGGDRGAIAGFQVQPFTGTYSGSFSLSPSISITLTLPLVQSTTANSHGNFLVSASTVTVTGGGPCGFSSATLVPTGSFVSGNDLDLLLLGSDSSSIMIISGATLDGTTNVVHGQAVMNTGACSTRVVPLTLTRS